MIRNKTDNEKNKGDALRAMLHDPGEKLNTDMLMDTVIALYTDLNSPQIKNNQNVKGQWLEIYTILRHSKVYDNYFSTTDKAFIARYEPFIQKLQNARPRIRFQLKSS